MLALKVLKFSYPRAMHYFKREFRSIAALSHPNLVSFHDLHVEDGQYFYTMELIDGTDVYEYVNGHNRVIRDPARLRAPDRLARIRHSLIQILRALSFLHGHGYIHRDIKPSNILVQKNGAVKLVDFGIVKELLPGGEGQSLSQVFGTATYFSPEQSLGSRVTSATDLYAVGVVLYEQLAGVPPFEGEGADVALAHRGEPPPPLESHVPGLPQDLMQVCMQLLAKAPADRPSAREALEILNAPLRPEDAPRTEFVGRRAIRKQLFRVLEAVRDGEGQAVLIEGASGSGKSALIKAFAESSRILGASAFTGTCVHRDHVPLRGLDTVVERLAEAYRKQVAQILRALPSHERAPLIKDFTFLGELLHDDQHGTPNGLGSGIGLHALLSALARARLLIVTVEHLELADEATFDVLEALSLGGRLPPILLIFTYPPNGVKPNSRVATFLEVLGAHPNTHRISLGPLNLDETRQLLEEHIDDPPESVAAHIQSQSGGLPFFIMQLIADIQRYPKAPPPTFEEMVARRVKDLPEISQYVLSAICLSLRPVPHKVLEVACRLDSDELYEALVPLTRSALVRIEGNKDGAHFAVPVHSRLMAVARSAMAYERASVMHELLARAYQAMEGRAEDIEYHWRMADKPERAWRFARGEAEEARRQGDHARASEMLALALEGTLPEETRAALQIQLAESLALSGRYLKAAEVLDSLKYLSAEESHRWNARKCQLYLMAGELSAFTENVEALPQSSERFHLADLLVPLEPRLAHKLLARSEDVQARLIRARLLADLADMERIDEARAILAAVDPATLSEADRRGHLLAGVQVDKACGDFEAATRKLEIAEAYTELSPTDLLGLRVRFERATLAIAQGQISTGRAIARELLVEVRTRGLRGFQVRVSLLQARILLEAGEHYAAHHLITSADQLWPKYPRALPSVFLALTQIRRYFYQDELDKMKAKLDELRADEALRPLLSRRRTARTFWILRGRLAVIEALTAQARGEVEARHVKALKRTMYYLQKMLPPPRDTFTACQAVKHLISGEAEAASSAITQRVDKEGWPSNPLEASILLAVLALIKHRLGQGGLEEIEAAINITREVGAGFSPELRLAQRTLIDAKHLPAQ